MNESLYVAAEEKTVDPITAEVIRNALTSVSEQMSVTIQRSSFSTIVTGKRC